MSDEATIAREVLEDMVTLDGDRLAEPAPRTPIVANGGAVAALIAAGFACALLGVLTLASDANLAVKETLTFSEAVGPLSGKTVLPTLAWLVVWRALHMRIAGREVDLRRGCIVAMTLVAVGLLLTFPPFYQLFAVPA